VSNTTKRVLKTLFFLLIIFLPSNLFLSFFSSTAYINGLQIDFLIPKLYASQIITLNILWVGFINIKGKNKFNLKKILLSNQLLTILSLVFIIRQFFTPQPLASIWFLGQLLLSISLFFFLQKNHWLLKTSSFYWSIFTSLVTQFFLAIYQFLQQKPLLPYFILGESRFEPYFRISRHLFNGKERILAYGSTSHPNILAGVVVIFFLILLNKSVKQPSKESLVHSTLALLATIITLHFTQSLSALLVLFFGGAMIVLPLLIKKNTLFKYKKNFLWIVLSMIIVFSPIIISSLTDNYPNESSITRRDQLNRAALSIFTDRWLLGAGLNQFTGVVEEYSSSAQTVRFVQPAHHVGLLILAEGGLLFVFIIVSIQKFFHKTNSESILMSLLLISPILVLDHYLFTLQIGQLLIVVLLTHQLALATKLE